MTKSKTKKLKKNNQSQNEAFTFDLTAAVTPSEGLIFQEMFFYSDYYMPPLDFEYLGKAFDISSALQSAIHAKKNSFISTFKSNKYISRKTLKASFLEYEIYGNCFLRKRFNALAQLHHLELVPAKSMRVGKNCYYYLLKNGEKIKFNREEIIHISEYTPHSSIYGLPEHYAAIAEAVLGRESTLYKTKFYKNGAHMGYILHYHDPEMDETFREELEETVTGSKGAGNGRCMVLSSKAKGESKPEVNIIEIGGVSSKDDFEKIKKISTADILMAKRVPPCMLAVIPDGAHFGDSDKAVKIYGINEIAPQQGDFMEEINGHLPEDGQLEFTNFSDQILVSNAS